VPDLEATKNKKHSLAGFLKNVVSSFRKCNVAYFQFWVPVLESESNIDRNPTEQRNGSKTADRIWKIRNINFGNLNNNAAVVETQEIIWLNLFCITRTHHGLFCVYCSIIHESCRHWQWVLNLFSIKRCTKLIRTVGQGLPESELTMSYKKSLSVTRLRARDHFS
jgi:hypothetical protein